MKDYDSSMAIVKKKRRGILHARRIATGRSTTGETAGIGACFYEACVACVARFRACAQAGEGTGLDCPFTWNLVIRGFWSQGDHCTAL